MQKASFFSLFDRLSYKERKAFRLFLSSPYFNRRAELVSLFDLINDSEGHLLDKERVYKRIFDTEDYDDLHWRHTASFFKKGLEQFLALRHWQEDEMDQSLRLAESLRKKELIGQYERELKKTFQKLESEPFRDLNYHYTKYRLYLEQYEYAHRIRRGGKMFLQEQTDALTIFYISGVLRQSCIILSHQNLQQKDYNQLLLDAVLEEASKGLLLHEPAVSLYYYSLLALRDAENETAFAKCTELIDEHWKAFHPTEIRDIYILAINYCIRKLNKGQREYVQKAFDLYRSGLDRKCLLDQGQISPFAYKNVLMLGMSLGEHEYVEEFLYSYKRFLAPELRENTFNYNLAIYYFRKPDYDQAMSLLQQVDFKDVLNNLDARRMLLRIYYETESFEALDSHLDSFRQYISRQKELGYHRDSYMNLIRFMKKTLRTNIYDEKKREALRKEVMSADAFVEKDWLVEQLG